MTLCPPPNYYNPSTIRDGRVQLTPFTYCNIQLIPKPNAMSLAILPHNLSSKSIEAACRLIKVPTDLLQFIKVGHRPAISGQQQPRNSQQNCHCSFWAESTSEIRIILIKILERGYQYNPFHFSKFKRESVKQNNKAANPKQKSSKLSKHSFRLGKT